MTRSVWCCSGSIFPLSSLSFDVVSAGGSAVVRSNSRKHRASSKCGAAPCDVSTPLVCMAAGVSPIGQEMVKIRKMIASVLLAIEVLLGIKIVETS